MREVPITLTKTPKEKCGSDTKLGFGKCFTDHMLVMDYTRARGWHDMRIEPYAPFSVDPASVVLHYGQAIFEGLKCYADGTGKLRLFRPDRNFARMNASAARMSMPPLDEAQCLQGLLALLALERDWVPTREGTSLYVRPAIIATDVGLGVHASERYRFFIILSPSGAYYEAGLAPIGIYVEDELVRAVRGGIGFAKAAANYAASLYAGVVAEAKGYAQVLWLDGIERRYVEEVGSMNIMFVLNGALVTPALNGSILPGITRDSVMTLARDMGLGVSERRITIDEVFQGARSGTLTEAFGTGTAAVVSPVGSLYMAGETVTIGDGGIGPVTRRLYDTLTGIQRGEIADTRGWTLMF